MKKQRDEIIKIQLLKEWDEVLEKEISRLFVVSYPHRKRLIEVPYYDSMDFKNREKSNNLLKKKYYAYLKDLIRLYDMDYSELLECDVVSIIDSDTSSFVKSGFFRQVERLRDANQKMRIRSFHEAKELAAFSFGVSLSNFVACVGTNLVTSVSNIPITAFSYTTFFCFWLFSSWNDSKLRLVVENSSPSMKKKNEIIKKMHSVYMLLGYILTFYTVLARTGLETEDYKQLSVMEREAVGDVDLDDILSAYDANVRIPEEYQELIPGIMDYLEDNPYLDEARLYLKARDLIVKDNQNLPNYVSGGYIDEDPTILLKWRTPTNNESTFYHELIHMTGCYKNGNSLCSSLTEGMTSLLCNEYFGSGRDLDEYDSYRKVVKIFCELVGSDVMLESFSNFEDIRSKDSVLRQAFLEVYSDEKTYEELLDSLVMLDNSFSSYMDDDFTNYDDCFKEFYYCFASSITPYIQARSNDKNFDLGTTTDYLMSLKHSNSDSSKKAYFNDDLEEYLKVLEKIKFE